MKKTKKRNPQDSTLRNIRALKKRVEKLEEHQRRVADYLYYITDNFLVPSAMPVFKEVIEGK